MSKTIEVEGYSISPFVATTTTFLAISYVGMVAAPSPFVFATLTNLCYLAAGFHREIASSTDKHSAMFLSGQMAGGALVLVLIGASSFAFHRESEMYSPAHTLDITFGWLVVAHVFYVSFSVSVLGLVSYCSGSSRLRTQAMRIVRRVLSLGFLTFVTILFVFYDTFYGHQKQLYFALGPAAAVFGGICRFILVKSFDWAAIRVALWEVAVALTAVFAAILSQCELLGRRCNKGDSGEDYDFYHGQWHALLSLVVGMLYTRAADAARVVQRTHTVCICDLPALDFAAEILILLYSVLVIVFKETQVNIAFSKAILGTVCALFMVHAAVTVMHTFLKPKPPPAAPSSAYTPVTPVITFKPPRGNP
tara:strand:+ start:17385 stop:18476 length:1092 start_codon:yes stop_codon:yes gene_type:complete